MTPITRDNVDHYLDAGQIYAAIRNGRWYEIRRNGATKTWKRDASRIAVPFKVGFKGYGKITESDFTALFNSLHSDNYRHVDDVPRNLRLARFRAFRITKA